MVESVTDMPYLKRLAGIVITLSLLIPIRGLCVVVATSTVLVLARLTRTAAMVMRAVKSRFVWFCPLLERSELI